MSENCHVVAEFISFSPTSGHNARVFRERTTGFVLVPSVLSTVRWLVRLQPKNGKNHSTSASVVLRRKAGNTKYLLFNRDDDENNQLKRNFPYASIQQLSLYYTFIYSIWTLVFGATLCCQFNLPLNYYD